jgi:hypothetical protein
MSRSRNIKPGFFKNEDLAGLPFWQRLLYIGLWTECDREGRCEDRPVKLKMALFPAVTGTPRQRLHPSIQRRQSPLYSGHRLA